MKVSVLIGIVCAFAILILGGMVVILRNQLQTKELELKTAAETIKLQAESIDRITAQRKVDDRIVTELTKGLAEIKVASEAQTTAITELEKSDPDAKNFLAITVPDSLKRLLTGSAGSADGSSTSPAR